jgi:hypothetical protein
LTNTKNMAQQRGASSVDAVKEPHSVSLKVLRYYIPILVFKPTFHSSITHILPDYQDHLSLSNILFPFRHPLRRRPRLPASTLLQPPPYHTPPPKMMHLSSLLSSLSHQLSAAPMWARHSPAPFVQTTRLSSVHLPKRQ